MSDIIIASIITSFAVLFSPVLVLLFSETFKAKKITLFQKGDKFEGVWYFDDSDKMTNEEISIISTSFRKIKGIGRLLHEGKPKEYKLFGRQYKYCTTFEFLGTNNGQMDETAGVIILNSSSPNRNILEGRWAQLNIHGALIGGKVIFTRVL